MKKEKNGNISVITRITLSGAICFAALLVAGCNGPDSSQPDLAAVAYIAHGGFFTASGEPVEPTLERIRATQKHYIDLLKEAPKASAVPAELIFELVTDPIVANALYLDQLLLAVAPKKRAYWEGVNDATRLEYLVRLRGDEAPQMGETWHRGVPAEVAEKLEAAGVFVSVRVHNGGRVQASSGSSGDVVATPLVIDTEGDSYVAQCREEGVPIPNRVLDTSWDNLGQLTTRIGLSSTYDRAELWSYKSTSPTGTCLALSLSDDTKAPHLDLICLGTESGKACFFEGNENTPSRPEVGELFGGTALFGGICSDCHAGENSFIIHPDDPVFADLLMSDVQLMPLQWYEPLVQAGWPQNPGPMTSLGPVSEGQQKCTSCHVSGGAGRFPRVTELNGYCIEVVKYTVGDTMPPNGAEYHDFEDHGERIKQLCGMGDNGDFGPTNNTDDWKNVGAPTIATPIYECADVVGVQSLRLDGKVQLVVETANGAVKHDESRTVSNTSLEEFTIPGGLKKGDRVYASQLVDSTASPNSDTVVVRSYLDDYPDGVPKPSISPTVYECGERIAAHHLPGAQLKTWVDGAAPTPSEGGATGLSVAAASGPFQVGDQITLSQSLCGMESPASDPVTVIAAPRTLPAPTVSPLALYAGQVETVITALLPSTNLRVSEASFGVLENVTAWPMSWFAMKFYQTPFGPLQQGNVIKLQQELCGPSSEVTEITVQPCANLPAPTIVPAFDGDDFVILDQHVDGAVIRVWDASGEELGEGRGPDVDLGRSLSAGEQVNVTQEVFGCFSSEAYYTQVLN